MSIRKRKGLLLRMLVEIINEDVDESETQRKKKRIWFKPLHDRGETNLSYSSLRNDLLMSGPEFYRSFTRFSEDEFKNILQIIQPLIHKQDTCMRVAISDEERLAITLRFLSTGQSYFSLATTFRCAKSTIQEIIKDVCSAINTLMFRDWIKVCILYYFNLSTKTFSS